MRLIDPNFGKVNALFSRRAFTPGSFDAITLALFDVRADDGMEAVPFGKFSSSLLVPLHGRS